MTTEYPLALELPVFATVPRAVKVWPLLIVPGTPLSVISSTGGAPLLTVTLTAPELV